MKKIRNLLIFLIIVVILLIFALLAYKYLNPKKEKEEVKILKTIPGYGYTLKENASELYKANYKELEALLKKDSFEEESYAKQVAKMFIIDFYTLDNKMSKNDVGGVDFIKPDMADNFIEEARSTFYRYIEVKTDERKQDLPVVSDVEIESIEKTTFVIKDKTTTTTSKGAAKTTTKNMGKEVEAYKVVVTWEYEEDLGYETSASMIIIKEDKKLYVVEMD